MTKLRVLNKAIFLGSWGGSTIITRVFISEREKQEGQNQREV